MVVSDRFLDSSLAYQGGARGLGVDEVERREPDGDRRAPARHNDLAGPRPGRGRRARRRERPLRGGGRGSSETVRETYERAGRRPSPAGGAASTPPARRRPCTPTCWPWCEGVLAEQRVSAADLAGTEDHPQARMVLGAELGRLALARLPVPRARGHGQETRGAGLRRRAAGRGRPTSPTTVRRRVQHGTHPDLTWVARRGAHVMRVEDVEGPVVSRGHAHAVRSPAAGVRAGTRGHDERRGGQPDAEDAGGAGALRAPDPPHRGAGPRARGRWCRGASSCASTRCRRRGSPEGLEAEGMPAERAMACAGLSLGNGDARSLPRVGGGQRAASGGGARSWPPRWRGRPRRAGAVAGAARAGRARRAAAEEAAAEERERRLELEPKGRERRAMEARDGGGGEA